MKIKVCLIDENGKPFDNYKVIDVANDSIKIVIKNNDTDFSLEELRWLRTAMIDMVYGGGTPETMRDYLNILDKIENIIKRKWDK